jgi:hypothetical protein
MHETVEKAKSALAGFNGKAEVLRSLADFVVSRDH